MERERELVLPWKFYKLCLDYRAYRKSEDEILLGKKIYVLAGGYNYEQEKRMLIDPIKMHFARSLGLNSEEFDDFTKG